MYKKLLCLLLLCFGSLLSASAQDGLQKVSGGFSANGALDQWTEWKTHTYKSGTTIQHRAMLSSAKKGCKMVVEIKNMSNDKIQLLAVFAYRIANVSTPMSGTEKLTVKAGAVESISYSASFCGGKGNDYNACYSCDPEYTFVLR